MSSGLLSSSGWGRGVWFAAAFLSAMAVSAQDGSGAQGDPFVGEWTGIITQDLGATTRYFDMTMSVAEPAPGDSLYQVSTQVADGNYNAFMSGRAFVADDGQLYVAEDLIVRADSIPDMAWCVKRLTLAQSMEAGELHLRGRWEGDTYFGACDPGDLDLIRQVVRP